MITSDNELIGQSNAKGFRPLYEAMEDEANLQSRLGTGSSYKWVDRRGNTVDFTCSKKETKKPELPITPKGFRGYQQPHQTY